MMEHEKEARELVDELSNNFEAWVGHADVHYTEVCVLAPRELPAGFLEVVSQYGDMRIEGIRHDENMAEVSIFI